MGLMNSLTPTSLLQYTANRKPFEVPDIDRLSISRPDESDGHLVFSGLVKEQRRVQDGRWSTRIVSILILITMTVHFLRGELSNLFAHLETL